MSAMGGFVPVLAAPALDPGQARIDAQAPVGLTIAEIIDFVLPDRAVAREMLRVTLVTAQGVQEVSPLVWHRARPHAGVHVVIRVIPGKSVLKSVLSIVVAIAAVALGAFFAPALAGALGISTGLAQGLIGLGVTALGNLLINALIPPPKPEDQERRNQYTISGWRNRLDLDGAVPFVFGTMRYAPPFAALSYSEIVGDDHYIRALFNFGYGRVATDQYRIGETDLTEFEKVTPMSREGLSTDTAISLYPRQVLEESIGADLTRPLPRDDRGEVIDGAAIETPVTRTTGADASGASIIIAFPAGLFRSNDEGKLRQTSVSIRIRQRLVQAENWTNVQTLTVTAKKREAIYRQLRWNFPTRGRWQIELTMITPETTSLQTQNRCSWAALQTLRPEYPINFPVPLALVGIRIKATHQLNGQLDNFSARCRRYLLDYEHTTGQWVERISSNPASAFILALTHKANPRRVDLDGIDMEQMADWHDFCRIKGLKYDFVADDASKTLRDILTEVAAAGRAGPRHDGVKWGVVIDRPQELVVDHLNPRNSYNFSASRSYFRPPHGFRVKFLDQTNDYKPAERIVRWPGYAGSIELTEALELPGKTDPAEIYREARRRMYETIHRPDVFQVSQDGPARVATRGDLVMLSHDVLDRTQAAIRVRSAIDNAVELVEPVEMFAGTTYGVRFRVYAGEDDTIGTSIVRTIAADEGETALLMLTGTGPLPAPGEIIHFGVASSESEPVVVSGSEAGEDLSVHLRLLPAATVIDQLTDAEVIPPWSGRAGAEIAPDPTGPNAPRFTSVSYGVSGIEYLVETGAGLPEAVRFEVDHRLIGATVWQTVTIAAGDGGGSIGGYANGDTAQLRVRGISEAGVAGPNSAIVTFAVDGASANIPAALDATMITVGALLGGASVQFATGADTKTRQIQLYRSTSSALNRLTDAQGAPLAVERSRSYSAPIGDTTRQSLLTNGGMDSASTWTLGTGWSIASGRASHASGSASTISQPVALQEGKVYRCAFTLASVTAGNLTPRLSGGSVQAGVARSANASVTDRIQAAAGNNTFELAASSTFVGSVDDVVVYLETETCLSQGTHFIWLEPQNEDGVPGPIAGPFSVQIR